MHTPSFAHTALGEADAGVEASGPAARGVEAVAAPRTPRLAGHTAVTAVRSAGGRLVVVCPEIGA